MRDIRVFLSGVCSAAAVVGIIGTAVSAVVATPKALDILDKAERDKGASHRVWHCKYVHRGGSGGQGYS